MKPIEPVRLEGGLYAVQRLIGPYDDCTHFSGVVRALYTGWLPQSGYARDNRPGLELYRNMPLSELRCECVTDLMIPVRKD